MITIKLLNSPGYPTRDASHFGTVWHYPDKAFAVSVNADYPSTLAIRRYLGGVEPPNYPVPAIPTEIDIQPHWVVMFQWVGLKMNGNYLKETLLAMSDDCFFIPIT